MNSILVDSSHDDDTRRTRVFDGQVYVFSPTPSSLAFCDFARGLLQEAFAPLDPLEAQFKLPVERFVEILAPLVPRFVHHPESKKYTRGIMKDLGCDLAKVYLDVPKMRTQTHAGYLTAGVGYQLHPHRDTWYSAPMCQLNWWLPIYPIEPESSVAFFPRYWTRGVANGSHQFNYYEWNATGRKVAARQIKQDSRKQPKAEEALELDPQIRIVTRPGGLLLFSGASLHATVPNTSGRTRFSIDFRTVHYDDVVGKRGAPNVDSHSTGTSLRDFIRGTDSARLPDDVVALYEDHPPTSGVLVFEPGVLDAGPIAAGGPAA
jgi:hypothetical protein